MEDPFDLVTLSSSLAAALATARHERLASKRGGSKPPKSQKRFTKVPGIWEETLAKARVGGSTYAVAYVLLYEAWKLTSNGREPIVKLTSVMLSRVHVKEHAKRIALRNLRQLGLVGVEQQPGRSPLVTVHFLD